MANRYPLILDTADSNKIKELQTGDNLNLADNSIVGVQNITALGTIEAAVITVQGNRLVAQNFLQLSDTPSTYTDNADKFVAVNAAGTAIEFRPLSAFGNVDVASLDTTGDILPVTPNTASLGASNKQFANVYSVDLIGNLRAFNDDLIFNASTGKIAYAALSGTPSNVSEFTNDAGFVSGSDLNTAVSNYFAGGATFTSDITGSLFGDDSTMLVDGTRSKIVGDIHYPTTGSITAGTKVLLGTTELTSTFTPPTTNTGSIGTTSLRFGIGYFQNINASGNITAATFNGTLNGVLIGEHVGSVFGDDSTVLVDGVGGQIVGDVNSSIVQGGYFKPKDNSADIGAANDKFRNAYFSGSLDASSFTTAQLRTTETKVALGSQAGNVTQGNNSIAIGTNAGQTNQASTSIAIGANAGTTNQATGSIIINATGGAVENTVNASLVIKPIRSAPNANFLKYDVSTGEVTYEADAAGVFTGDLTGSVFADDSTILIDGVAGKHVFTNNVIADLSNVSANAPSVGQVLKWDGSQWAPAVDATSGGGGLDADTLNGQNGAYYLAWSNFSGTPTTIAGYGITDSVTNSSTHTFTNKTIDQDGTGNSITNIANASIKAAAGIDATKIADGTVTSTEFQYIGGLTSDAQTQITAKAALTDISAALGGASGGGSIAYNNATGVITFSPADLTSINIVSDTSPQLGGTLDANGNIIDMGVNTINDTVVGNWNTAYGWGNHASASYLTAITGQNLSNLSDVHNATPTNGQVLTWDQSNTRWAPAAAGGGGSIGNFTFASSNIDTDDSSGITLTPAITFESDVTVQNDLVVNNTVRANKFVSTAVGAPKITSATNIELNASGVVIIGSSALRIKSFTTTERNALTASTGDVIYNSTLLKMQIRIGSAWKSISISDDIPTNNNQLSNGAGYLTTATDIHTFTMTSNGSSAYRFAQDTRYFPLGTEDDPVLYVRRGETYHFINNSGGSHPFQIRVSNGGSAYNTGVTNNGASSGTIVWTVPMTAPSTVYYQCTAHSGMGNTINIVT
jgi:hypothetical protein